MQEVRSALLPCQEEEMCRVRVWGYYYPSKVLVAEQEDQPSPHRLNLLDPTAICDESLGRETSYRWTRSCAIGAAEVCERFLDSEYTSATTTATS